MTLTLTTPAFVKAFDDMIEDLPSTEEEVAHSWAAAISAFSVGANVAAYKFLFPAIDSAKIAELEGLFLTSLGSMRFVEDMGENLTQWWSKMFWVGPPSPFVGSTQIKSTLIIGDELLSVPADEFSKFIVSKISDWMISNISVLVVNTATAPPSTIGVSLIE